MSRSNRGPGPIPGRNLLARPNPPPELYRGEEPARPDPLPQLKKTPPAPAPIGIVFAKCCKLPDREIDYANRQGAFPIDTAKDYGNLVLLGGREVDGSGELPLRRISGNIPAGFGSLALRGLAGPGAGASCGGLCGGTPAGGRIAAEAGGRAVGSSLLSGGVVGGTLLGVVAMLWPSSLGDGALYTEDQLRSMERGRTRVRIRVEEQPDGTLKGYGYNTQLRRDWEMIPVVQFATVGNQMVADLGDGIGLTWIPADTPSDTLGIPALEAAPQAPHIWIFPPTEQTDKIIVNPIYPPEYRDFILVFPAGSGIAPLYIVMNARHDPGTVTGAGEDVSGIWLAGAGEGLGVPVPTRIADELRGKSFNSFDSFRAAFWKAVANDAELAGQFNTHNLADMRRGLAPSALRRTHAGKRISFELHHVEQIKDGGAVYDLDNLRAVTPQHHIDLHRGK